MTRRYLTTLNGLAPDHSTGLPTRLGDGAKLMQQHIVPERLSVPHSPRHTLPERQFRGGLEESSNTDSKESEEDEPQDDFHVIHADLIIFGPADTKPMKQASVVMQSKTIKWVGPTVDLPKKYRDTPFTTVHTLLPGLWDAHVHFIGITSFNFREILNTPDVAKGVRLARNCHDLLMAGFTSVRDLGGSGPEISRVIEDPDSGVVGPHIYGAGSALSQTAGHGDVFDVSPETAYRKLGVNSHGDSNGGWCGAGALCLCDGVEECRKAVRLQIRRGAVCIKVFASGGVLSIMDDPMRQQFSDDELSVIVHEARRHGRIVAAHVHGKDGIMAALRAGVGTLEHGTYLDEECTDIMKRQHVVYVPTRTIVVEGLKHPELMSPESAKKMQRIGKDHLAAYQLAVREGVKVVLGTDSGISTPGTGLSLGSGGSELYYAVHDGKMHELQAIEAATANGPLCLGSLGMAPRAGRVEVGFDADLVGLSESPLDGNMKVFMDVDKVEFVWKDGVLMKGPGSKRVW